MTLETWLPAVLGYLIPIGVFLLAWGGMPPQKARRSTTLGTLALALGALGYFAVGFAFHLGGAWVLTQRPGLEGLDVLYGGGGAREWGLIGLTGFFLSDGATTPEALSLFITYLPMATTAVLLVVLSVSERLPDWQMALLGTIVAAILFPLAACWIWGGGWLSQLGVTLEQGHGVVDQSGSIVVYLLSGVASLGAWVGIGKRLERAEEEDVAEMPPAHFPLLANVGVLLFGLGWLGWSLSQPFHVVDAQLNLPHIAVSGLLAGAGAILASHAYCWITVGHADPLMSARGAAVGFIAISAGAPFVPAWAALLIGIGAGFLLPLGVYLVEHVLRFPDATATTAMGVIGGLWGALAVAVFANGRWGQGWNGVGATEYFGVTGQGVTGLIPAQGLTMVGPGQLIAQLFGIGAIALLAFLIGWLSTLAMNVSFRREATEAPETEGPTASPS